MTPNETNIDNLYNKLVDLYAGRELSSEAEEELTAYAEKTPAIKADMRSLRDAVDLLQAEEAPEFTEEAYQRILLKMYTRGVQIQTQTPDPYHLQYQLPIQG